jgi:hypothetical protein
MADPFKPKFVDLVRNYTTTTGTGNIVLGQPVQGHDGLAQAVAVGERFFYAISGVDKPVEREVGRGTLLANGTIAREPIVGPLTNFTTGSKTIALVVGAEWFNKVGSWINGGAENLAGLTTANKTSLVAAVHELAASTGGSGGAAAPGLTFSACAGSSIASAVKVVDTVGYATAGVGGARYVFDAAVNAAFVSANPGTAFLAADGRGFRLDPAQRLTIEMFGAVGDGTTDNYAAIMTASRFKPKADRNYVPAVHWQGLTFLISATLDIQAVVRWIGEGTGANTGSVNAPSPTRIVAPANTTVIRNHNSNTTPTGAQPVGYTSAATSYYEGISFQQASQGTNPDAHCFHMRGTAILKRCEFRVSSGHGCYIAATATSGGLTEGDCNNWVVDDCFAHTIAYDALHIVGNDANAGLSIHFKTAGNTIGGCGIRDASGLGNVHLAPQVTGYGNTGVSYGGSHNVLVTHDNINRGSTVTPGTDENVWRRVRAGGPTASNPLWVAGTAYKFTLPLLICGPSNTSTVLGGYEEVGGNGLCHVTGSAMILGGNYLTTDDSAVLLNNPLLQMPAAKKGIAAGYRRAEVGDPLHANQGLYSYTAIGTPNFYGLQYPNNLIEYRREKDGELSCILGWEGNDLSWGYATRKTVYSISGLGTAKTFGRSSAQPHYLTLHDFALQDPSDTNIARIMGLRFTGPPTTGHQATGEVMWTSYKTVNFPMAAYVCTAAGTPGTWRVCASAAF